MLAYGVVSYATYLLLGAEKMGPFADHIRLPLEWARVAEVVAAPAEWLPQASADVVESLCDLYDVHPIRKAAA
jgi:hypothetical protein